MLAAAGPCEEGWILARGSWVRGNFSAVGFETLRKRKCVQKEDPRIAESAEKELVACCAVSEENVITIWKHFPWVVMAGGNQPERTKTFFSRYSSSEGDRGLFSARQLRESLCILGSGRGAWGTYQVEVYIRSATGIFFGGR